MRGEERFEDLVVAELEFLGGLVTEGEPVTNLTKQGRFHMTKSY